MSNFVINIKKMLRLKKYTPIFTPFQFLVAGYAFVTLIGALLLSLPISSSKNTYQPFIDSLFVATSGISTSGLSVVDIGSYYSLFGQIVLLCIFQVGGIGYMSIIICLISMFDVKISLFSKNVAVESISGTSYGQLNKFLISVIIFTAIFEVIGAAILTGVFLDTYSLRRSVYLGIFHSISAFCTAGFSVFPDSLMKYNCNIILNMTINILSLAGGIGFIVIYEIFIIFRKKLKNKHVFSLSVHSKFVILTTIVFITIGSYIIYFSENWQSGLSEYDKWQISVFQSISASTTDGFNTMDISKMHSGSLTYLIFQMFTGAAPGSTGGGIKVTTMGLILIFLIYQLRGRENNIHIFKHQIPNKSITKAAGIFVWFIIIIFADLLILLYTEKVSLLELLFEITSALGNTGLSMGITSKLSFIGKFFLTITMFIGRVGPLTIGLFFAGKQIESSVRYSEEDIYIG